MADIGKFDDRPAHGEGVTFTHKRPDLPGEASRTFKGRIKGGQQVWDIQAPESTSGGGGGGVVFKKFGDASSVDLIQVPGDEVWILRNEGWDPEGNQLKHEFGAYLVPYDPKEPEDWTSYNNGPTTWASLHGTSGYPASSITRVIAWRTATGVHIAIRQSNGTKSYHQIAFYTNALSLFHYGSGGSSEGPIVAGYWNDYQNIDRDTIFFEPEITVNGHPVISTENQHDTHSFSVPRYKDLDGQIISPWSHAGKAVSDPRTDYRFDQGTYRVQQIYSTGQGTSYERQGIFVRLGNGVS